MSIPQKLVCALATAFLCACGTSDEQPVAVPSELAVLEGAVDVKRQTRADGGFEVHYRLDQPFPAERVLNHLRSVLPPEKWQPLKEQWMNPGNPTSHVDGWGKFVNATEKPNTLVHSWAASWKDEEGNIVDYGLRYRSVCHDGSLCSSRNGHPDNSTLHVTGLWLPAATIEALQEASRQQR